MSEWVQQSACCYVRDFDTPAGRWRVRTQWPAQVRTTLAFVGGAESIVAETELAEEPTAEEQCEAAECWAGMLLIRAGEAIMAGG